MKKLMNVLPAILVAGGLTLGAMVAAPAFADDPKTGGDHKDHDHSKEKGDKKRELRDGAKKEDKAGTAVGSMAPAFDLKDTDGTAHTLSQYKGKIVVLEWFNPDCPFVVKHHKVNTTFNKLHDDYSKQNVVFLAVNSSAAGKEGAGLDRNKEAKTDFKMAYPILMDESGTVGKAYGAKTTPHVFIIDAEGKLVYAGAIDNDNSAKKAGDKNYAKMALDEIIAKKPVTTATTKPYGCGVKYGK